MRATPLRPAALAGVLALVAGVFASFHADAEEPTKDAAASAIAKTVSDPALATPEEVGRWIKDLSHDAFTVRQAAAARLLAAGMPARQQLLAIVDGPDPETRAAARRLVALIDQTEFHRRLEAFAADTDGRLGLSLPGWEQYKELVGGDAAARALFVDMQRQEGSLISAAFGVSKRTPEDLWEARLLRLVQWQSTVGDRSATPALGSCAAMLFLGSVSEMDVSENAAVLIENLIQRPPIRETLQAQGPHDAMRRLVVGWLLHCPNKNEEILKHRLNLISMTGLEEALPLAISVIGREKQYERVQSSTRALAVLTIGQLGRREHVERLEPLLEDAAVCLSVPMQVPGQPATSVQVRDVALVVMLHLTEQRPADYGYVNARPQPPRTFQLQTLYRDNDGQRAEAIAKWRAWRAENNGKDASAK